VKCVDVFWIVTPCNVVVGYQRFEGPEETSPPCKPQHLSSEGLIKWVIVLNSAKTRNMQKPVSI